MGTYVPMAARKIAEYRRARKLRAEGLSLNRISAELGVAKSSVSVWVRDVPVPVEPEVPAPQDGTYQAECRKCRQIKWLRERTDRPGWCSDCVRAYFKGRGALHVKQVT